MTGPLHVRTRWAKPLFALTIAVLYLMLGLLTVGLFALEIGSTVFFIGITCALAALYLLTLLVRGQFKELRHAASRTLPADGPSTPAAKTRAPFRFAAGLLAMLSFAMGVMLSIAVIRDWSQVRQDGDAGWILGMMTLLFVFAALMGYAALPGKELPRQVARADSRQ